MKSHSTLDETAKLLKEVAKLQKETDQFLLWSQKGKTPEKEQGKQSLDAKKSTEEDGIEMANVSDLPSFNFNLGRK